MDKKLIRKNFRESVFKRDDYVCQGCGFKGCEDTLDAHHIVDRHDMPNGGYVKENGITLCKEKCHMIAEQFHISNGKSFIKGFTPYDLYIKINSSYDEAFEASERLK